MEAVSLCRRDVTENEEIDFSTLEYTDISLKGTFPSVKNDESFPELTFVDKLKERDSLAMKEMVENYSNNVYGFALKILKNEADAADVVQDTMLKVYEKIHMLRDQAALSSWIYRIASNIAYMKIRKIKKENHLSIEDCMPQFNLDGTHLQAVSNWAATAENKLLTHELAEILCAAIDRLTAKDKTILTLRDMEGFSTKEVAEIMEMSISAVKSRLHRARLYLRECLARHYEEKGAVWQREFYV